MKTRLMMIALLAASLPAIAQAGVTIQVPEPSTLALLGAGMVTLLIVRSRGSR